MSFNINLQDNIYEIALEESPALTALYTGPEITIQFANRLMLQAWGKDRSVIGKTLREAVPELEGQPFFGYFDKVYQTGQAYVSAEERAELVVNGELSTFFFTFTYKPLKHDDGTVWGIIHTASDVTAEVLSKNAELENEKNLRNVILQSPVASAIYSGHEFILTVANSKMLELIGKTAEQVIGKPIIAGLPELEGQGYEAILSKVFQTGDAFEAKEQPVYLSRNGQPELVYIDFSYTPIKNARGKITDILALAYNVTDLINSKMQMQAAAEEKDKIAKDLWAERERLNLILETMAEGVGITDAEGNMVYANPMAQQILGITKDEILERTYSDPKWKNLRIDGSPLPDEEHPMSVALTTGKLVFDHEIAIQQISGERVYLSINAAAVRDQNGNIIAAIGSFMDVTQRRLLTQQKDEFISIASHELKTPLTTVKAGVQLIERHLRNNPDSAESLAGIVSFTSANLKKLGSLVEDLLNTTKIEKGQLALKKEKFLISDLIEECCAHISFTGTHEMISEGDLDVEVCADRQRIEQVIVNLVNNAVKYSPGANKVIISAAREGANVKVSVEDFGIGIPEAKANKIFDRFYQVDSLGIQFSGLGLGLYISAEIIRQHRGEIGVNSTLGKGSVFWFSIPVN